MTANPRSKHTGLVSSIPASKTDRIQRSDVLRSSSDYVIHACGALFGQSLPWQLVQCVQACYDIILIILLQRGHTQDTATKPYNMQDMCPAGMKGYPPHFTTHLARKVIFDASDLGQGYKFTLFNLWSPELLLGAALEFQAGLFLSLERNKCVR